MTGEKKPKKPMTEEQLERLAIARQKANEIRKINQAKRLQNKMDNLKYNPDGTLKEGNAPHAENIEQEPQEELKEEQPQEEQEKPQMTITQTTASLEGELQEEEVIIKKKKPVKKKKQMVIVEQSDDDSDEFESNDRVVFVKRVTKNKKVPIVPIVPQNPEPAELPKPPPPPKKTKNELLYDSMFTGGFLNPMTRRF
jgi:hypothetical protein